MIIQHGRQYPLFRVRTFSLHRWHLPPVRTSFQQDRHKPILDTAGFFLQSRQRDMKMPKRRCCYCGHQGWNKRRSVLNPGEWMCASRSECYSHKRLLPAPCVPRLGHVHPEDDSRECADNQVPQFSCCRMPEREVHHVMRSKEHIPPETGQG